MIDYCVISRFANFLSFVKDKPNVYNVYIWVHDVFPFGDLICDPKNFKSVITLSEWQRSIIKENLGVPDQLLTILDNCIDIADFPNDKPEFIMSLKKKNSFIYSSSVERGFVHLLDIFPLILEKIPDATLVVCCNISPNGNIYTDILTKLDLLEHLIGTSIFLKGRLERSLLYEEFEKAEYFLYPSTEPETFCISATEAQASGCICITTDYAALNTTVSRRGHMIPYNGTMSVVEFANETIKFIENLDNYDKLRYITMSLDYAKEHSIEKIGAKMLEIFES